MEKWFVWGLAVLLGVKLLGGSCWIAYQVGKDKGYAQGERSGELECELQHSFDKPEQMAIDEQTAIDCKRSGGYPVMGYGDTVCLEMDVVRWWVEQEVH